MTQSSDLLNQPRCLRINFSTSVTIDYSQLKYCLEVATSYELYIEKLQEIEVLAFQMLLHKIVKINKKYKEMGLVPKKVKWLVLGLNFKINVDLLS